MTADYPMLDEAHIPPLHTLATLHSSSLLKSSVLEARIGGMQLPCFVKHE